MLKRGCWILLVAVALAACDDDGPTAPDDPNVVVFTAQLSAASEVPPITGAEANARGDVRITFNLTRDAANNVTGATANFVVNLSNFPAGAVWRQAHIHEGAAGIAGGVRVDTGLTPDTAITLTNGSISNREFSNRPVEAPVMNNILSNPAGFYFNAHSAANPTGAVRGQLVRQ